MRSFTAHIILTGKFLPTRKSATAASRIPAWWTWPAKPLILIGQNPFLLATAIRIWNAPRARAFMGFIIGRAAYWIV